MPDYKWERVVETGDGSTEHLSVLSHSPDSNSSILSFLASGPIANLSESGSDQLNITDPNCFGCVFPLGNQSDPLNSTGSFTPPDLYNNQSGQDELYEVPLTIIILLSLLYGGISVAALIGNMLILWVVAISRRMRTVTNMFIANLALADIIIGLFTIPFQFQAALLQRWNLPDFMCALCPFVQVLSVNISVFTLSAIAVDRYRAVIFPLSARVSKRKATWVILTIWSVGLLLALPTELDYKVIYLQDKGKLKPFCTNLGLTTSFRMYYVLSLVVIQYFFPLIIITGAYAHMATNLWGTTAPGNKEELRDAVVLRNKKKVIKMLALVVLLFALCWLPLQTYNFLQTLIPSINQYQYINIIWFCFHWLAMSNSCCNPFIYAIYNDKFQREFRTRLWCLRLLCSRSSEDPLQYSDASDYDRTNVRASYRFKNNLTVRYNHQSVYSNNGSTRYKTTDIRRTGTHRSSPQSKGKSQRRPQYNSSPLHTPRENHRPSPDMNGCTGRGGPREYSGNNNDVGFTTTNIDTGSSTPSPVAPLPVVVIAVDGTGSNGRSCVNGAKTFTVVATDTADCRL